MSQHLQSPNSVTLREAIPRESLFLFYFFSKGWGVLPESKLLEELLVVVCVWIFFRKGGGVASFQTF